MNDEHDNIESSVLPLTDLMVVLIVILSAGQIAVQASRLAAFKDRLTSVRQSEAQIEDHQHLITVDERGCVAVDGKLAARETLDVPAEGESTAAVNPADNPQFAEDLRAALAPLKGDKALLAVDARTPNRFELPVRSILQSANLDYTQVAVPRDTGGGK